MTTTDTETQNDTNAQQNSQNSTQAPPEPQPTPYQLIGGEPAVRRIVERFYDIMDSAPEAAGIRAMHAADLAPMRERLFEFLSGWLGGPPLYFRRPDHKCIVSAHKPFPIGEAERDEWMLCMRRALEDCGVSEDMRTLLDKPFLRMADAFRNR
jgi:hemoglobin